MYEPGSESLNVATSLCGARHAVAVAPGLVARAEESGLKVIEDVRGVTEAEALSVTGASFRQGSSSTNRPGSRMHLRDYAVARHAFTFATEDPRGGVRPAGAGPMPLVFGWGQDERRLVEEVSGAGGVIIPADWC